MRMNGPELIKQLPEVVKNGKQESISLWHPSNGVWMHLTQVKEGDKIKYYTNEIFEKME